MRKKTFNKTSIIVYNIVVMKLLQKTLLLLSIGGLTLTACDFEKRCFCLETSKEENYTEGVCMQLSRKDIVEVAYVYCLASNPEASLGERKYEVTWNEEINWRQFSFTDGLKGKVFDSITIVGDGHTLKFEMHGLLRDQEATHGYIRISPQAFKAHTDNSKEAYLYAYFAIGDRTADVDKPDNITF